MGSDLSGCNADSALAMGNQIAETLTRLEDYDVDITLAPAPASASVGVVVLVRSSSGPILRFAAVCARLQAAEEGQVRRRLNLVAEPLNRWTRSQGCHR